MAEQHVTIDRATILDNSDARQIEFTGDASGERFHFAVKYEVLEALAGRVPGEDAFAIFQQFAGEIEGVATRALARDTDQPTVIVSGNDLA